MVRCNFFSCGQQQVKTRDLSVNHNTGKYSVIASAKTLSIPPATVTNVTTTTTPAWVWVIIAIGAVLVIAVIVLIARTRRV